ncbi:hypothetical protein RG71_17235 [Escherichia coli]|jgi:hypothetical protein|nr:hypothetical protein RG71_17235 [Escherichia coli]
MPVVKFNATVQTDCKPHLVLDDGAVLREQLRMVDEIRQTFSFRFIEFPLPIDNYVARVSMMTSMPICLRKVRISRSFLPKLTR